ncbi:MAG: RNA polymerase factor sigma-54 [Spirochaetes bacterium]|nr:RNA polymerase factor sigma-54 [Spirochaetota bacterium]
MKNALHLNLKLKQQLRLSPQMIQSIKLLMLSNLDLLTHIEQELSDNPLLESDNNSNVVDVDSNLYLNDPDMPNFDWVDYTDDPADVPAVHSDDDDKKRQFIEGGISEAKESLHEHLINQLRLACSDEELISLGETVISYINNDGYLTMDAPLIALDLSADAAVIEKIIATIKTFEPTGVGGRNLREVLLLQLAALKPRNELAERIADQHLTLLSQKDYTAIAKALNSDAERVRAAAGVIASCEPFPGRQFDNTKIRYIVPDLRIEKKEGEWHVVITDDYLPSLRINKKYGATLRTSGEDLGKFAAEKMGSALALIYAIEQRRKTLYKTGKAILELQHDFFEHGREHLKPLLLRDVASAIGMSESTVSRISNSKYIETSWGVFPVKYFFSVPVRSSSGTASKQSVKETIRLIIAENSGLSDEKIKALLSERGIEIARRTVAKYRKELKILSSRDR